MNLYHIVRNEEICWDEYDEAVVAAESASDARLMHPGRHMPKDGVIQDPWHEWTTDPDKIAVTLIGVALPESETGVICASYNAG